MTDHLPLQVVFCQEGLELALRVVTSVFNCYYALRVVLLDEPIDHLTQGLHALRPEYNVSSDHQVYLATISPLKELLVLPPLEYLYGDFLLVSSLLPVLPQ